VVAAGPLSDVAAPLKIALTGGIASGKSAVADAFARRGVPIIDTDRLAREVVEPGTAALAAVVEEFGPEILMPDGQLDRRLLRTVVFADERRRRRLEAILHPAIRSAMLAEIASIEAPYLVVAIPLLVESDQQSAFDRVLVVDCPPESQLQRLIARDAESPDGARAILAAQAGREARRAAADDLIENNGSLGDLDAAVERLHRRYLELAGITPPKRR
jgi:dephospho-CoA kinase